MKTTEDRRRKTDARSATSRPRAAVGRRPSVVAPTAAVRVVCGFAALLAASWGCEQGGNATAPPQVAAGKAAPAAKKPAAAKKQVPAGHVHKTPAEHEQELIARLAEEPDDVGSRLELANLYYDTHRPKLAIPAYQAVLEARPDDLSVRTDLGTCYRNIEKLALARAEFERVLKKDPSHVNATYNLAVVCHLAGDDARAAELWEKAAVLAAGTPIAEDAAKYAAALRRPAPVSKTSSDALKGFVSRRNKKGEKP